MKVVTVLGTRPELIRLSGIIRRLDDFCKHVVVHTGQNFDPDLSDVFFRELGIRKPDYAFPGVPAAFADQVGTIMSNVGQVLAAERPDAMLVLGDTNSALSVLIAKRAGVMVFHMEAGNRCYDDRVPEEVNRRVVDHASDVLMPYTQRAKENLLREGVPSERILVTGNPIYEVLTQHASRIDASDVHERLGLTPHEYFLVTVHRAETVDAETRLRDVIESLQMIREAYGEPVICSLHPRTRDRMQNLGLPFSQTKVSYLNPLGFVDFVALERKAHCVLTDSGTVQEECSVHHVPSVTLRDVTERPETLEAGSNILAGVRGQDVLRATQIALSLEANWEPPVGYLDADVSSKVVKIVLRGRSVG